jgi:hypothetical protein
MRYEYDHKEGVNTDLKGGGIGLLEGSASICILVVVYNNMIVTLYIR